MHNRFIYCRSKKVDVTADKKEERLLESLVIHANDVDVYSC